MIFGFGSPRPKKISAGEKPLPLKQRTSSSSDRRDFSHNTWLSLLVLVKFREFFITVDNFSIWRRHLAWAFEDGKDLRTYMTQRYASNMVFMSLLLSTELGVLFNSAHVTTEVRNNLVTSQHNTISFWAGLLIIISALLTILSLISTFTAWAMVSSIDDANAHCVLRSSIGQYAAELPGRLIVFSIYSFLISFMLFFFLLLPVGFWSILLLLSTWGLFLHVVSVFSGFGRIIMHAGAMGKERIFSPEYEEFLVPDSLHANLLKKAKSNLAHNTSIIRQYRRKQQPINRSLDEEQLWDHLNGNPDQALMASNVTSTHVSEAAVPLNRPRTDSTVRFADEEQGLSRGTHATAISGSHLSSARSVKEGGNGKAGSSCLGQKYRNKTSMSEPLQRPNFSESPLNQKTPRSADLPHRKHQNISLRPPSIPLKPEVSVRNVSTASLEKWLQGTSPKPIKKLDGSDDHRNSTTPQSGNGNETPGYDQLCLQVTHETGPPLFFDNTPLDSHPETFRCESDSIFSLCHLSTSSGARSERELSEDERFMLDYGDFYSDEDETNRHEMNGGTYNDAASPCQVEADACEMETEQSNLLGSLRNGNGHYASGQERPTVDRARP